MLSPVDGRAFYIREAERGGIVEPGEVKTLEDLTISPPEDTKMVVPDTRTSTTVVVAVAHFYNIFIYLGKIAVTGNALN